eukprot:jgi/Galph1/3947/GphlegSOOS_G2605.1
MNSTKNKIILISGATGCIGNAILKSLLQNTQHRVKLIVRKGSVWKLDSNLLKTYSNRCQLLIGDLRDKSFLTNAVKGVNCAILAATSWGGDDAFDVNVTSTLQIIHSLPHFCDVYYFSTASVIDSDGSLLEEAFKYGTAYLRSKYVALQRLLEEVPLSQRVTVIFPTLVFGQNSHLENAYSQIRSMMVYLKHIYLDASAHLIHAVDAASIIVHLVDMRSPVTGFTWHPSDPSRVLPAVVLGQPKFTADQVFRFICAKENITLSPLRIPLLSVFPSFLLIILIRHFGGTVDPWVLYCLRKRHFTYTNAVAPETFGLVSKVKTISQLFE